jgi:hypothetical protein
MTGLWPPEPKESVGERGHFPRKTSGCYYQRPEDCCWLCLGRIVLSQVPIGDVNGRGRNGGGSE